MELLIQIKQNYGKEAIYPACEKSRMFADLIGAKTLTRANIEAIKALGYSFKVVQQDL